MINPILVEYKYNNNIVEINLKNKKDCILRKYVYEYNKDNLIDNCKFYINNYDGSYNCINIRFDRDNNITKVFKNNVLIEDITKNDSQYIIKIYSIKEKGKVSNTIIIMFFNDHIDLYQYVNGDKKCGLKASCINYFDKCNRLIKSISNNKNVEKSKMLYDYDDKNRIIKKIIKSYKKDINYICTITQTFKYDEDNNRCICNINSKYNNINIMNETNDLDLYIPNMIENINFNTLESQHFLVEYGMSFLIYTNYLLLNPYNKDIGINFKYDNQSRVISKEIQLSDLSMK